MFKSTSQLKQDAKEALRGRWKEAVLLNIVPSVIQIISIVMATLITVGAILVAIFIMSSESGQSGYSNTLESEIATEFLESDEYGELDDSDDYDDYDDYESESTMSSAVAAITSSLSSVGFAPILTFVMTFLTIGISFTFLDVLRKGQAQNMSIKEAFRLFNGVDFVPVLLINVLMYVFTYLWTMLFIIPGLVKGYAYSQSNFIYKDMSDTKDTRGIGATTYITESRELMKGNKGRLFWLDITFIGWRIVGLLTFGIGFLFINPYINATKAAFYNDLAKDRYLSGDTIEEEDDEWTNF